MKKLFVLTLLFVSLCNTSKAQETSKIKLTNSFVEWNFGVAYIFEDYIAPGTSVLWGKSFVDENNLILEYELGFALPSLITGKFGIGKKINSTVVTFGIRPFPFNFYLQSSYNKSKKGYWIASLEFNPLDSESIVSFESKAILNFGYRWNLKNKQ